MSDAPERVWIDPTTGQVYRERGGKPPYRATGWRYVRADIHRETVKKWRLDLTALEAEVARLREAIKRIRFAVNSDSHAITFQTIGQYRTAILKVIAEETK